ncbi:MAG: diaminopimelate dehydrogenase [Oscillospiraceae bacterium]|nr:diaminopimelate dehydrogenase [Oscillospiraceae bacterium]
MIRIGIVGYGNLGRGVAKAVDICPDMELRAVFTRRDPRSIKIADSNVAVLSVDSVANMVDDIDVMIFCGGSASDLPVQGPFFASLFNTVDSYDTHAMIPGYMASIDAVAKNTTAIISTGWDPGLFSIMRVLFEAVLPDGDNYTFWGEGLSQGHSDAIRRIKGVLHAAQYTVPVESAVNSVRSGARPVLGTRQKHLRKCFVVADDDADKDEIENAIKTMPHYFADYNTSVHFIDADEFAKTHTNMPHGGMVLRSGNTVGVNTGDGNTVGVNTGDDRTFGHNQHMEFSLKLESNPEFTGSVLVAYARAAYRMSKEGLYGAKTVLDVPLSYLAIKDRLDVIRELL